MLQTKALRSWARDRVVLEFKTAQTEGWFLAGLSAGSCRRKGLAQNS
jgi:hypothetical protein